MQTISEMVAKKGLDVTKFKKFVESRNDQVTERSTERIKADWLGAFFTTLLKRNTIHDLWLFDDVIVVVAEDSQYRQDYKGGIGHDIYIYAVTVDLAEYVHPIFHGELSFRDMYDPQKDRQGPMPKEIRFIGWKEPSTEYPDQKWLKSVGIMPNGEERNFDFCFRPHG